MRRRASKWKAWCVLLRLSGFDPVHRFCRDSGRGWIFPVENCGSARDRLFAVDLLLLQVVPFTALRLSAVRFCMFSE
jgi:hypothetical protein